MTKTTKSFYFWVAASSADNTSVDSGRRVAESAEQAAEAEASERRSNPECIGEVVYARSDDSSDTAEATV